jgi:hypothetical protein
MTLAPSPTTGEVRPGGGGRLSRMTSGNQVIKAGESHIRHRRHRLSRSAACRRTNHPDAFTARHTSLSGKACVDRERGHKPS